MTIYLLYALLPLIIFPLTGTILIKVSRKLGTLLVAISRQLCLAIIGIPILFINPELFTKVVEYWREILLSGLFGSLYLFSVFKSADYIEMIQGRVINIVVRILFSILVGLLILGEVLNIYEIGGIIIILIGISLYLTIHNKNSIENYNLPLGIAISSIGGILFVASQYYFSIYAKTLTPISSAYLLELASVPFLLVMLLGSQGTQGFKKLSVLKRSDYKLLFFGSAPVLLGSYGLAQSYIHLDFILVNILFCGTLIMAGVFGYLILGEKLSKIQIIIFSFLLVGIFIVNYF